MSARITQRIESGLLEAAAFKHRRIDADPGRSDPLETSGTDSCGAEGAHSGLLFVDAGLFEDKQVVHRDHFSLRTRYFRDLNDLSRAARQAGTLDDDVDCRGDMPMDEPHRK